ncbi:MAG: class I SAM-dependent methyltransferase [Myxococcota bacterium]
MTDVGDHYERFPYPPIPSAALPRRGQGRTVSWEHGSARALGEQTSGRGRRILVVGAGTLEALVVGLANPGAEEVVALDLSARSLARLKRRVWLARARQWVLGLGLFHRVPTIRAVVGDVAVWESGTFDLIVASNVLHHHSEPAMLLRRLATWLRPRGLLRVVTYPKASRFWLRATARWLRLNGLGPETEQLVASAHQCVAELPAEHPIRLSFESNYESRSAVGIADAYFHPCENPLSPVEWRAAAEAAGLVLAAEDQHAYSRSTFVDEVSPGLAGLGAWQKLQLLDDLHELSTNPVLWFRQRDDDSTATEEGTEAAGDGAPESGVGLDPRLKPEALAAACLAGECPELWLPSDLQQEMGAGLHRLAGILAGEASTVEEVLRAFSEEVGTHLSGVDQRPLPGLAVHEHDGARMMSLPRPWPAERFGELGRLLGAAWHLRRRGERVPGDDLQAQTEWLHLTVGAKSPWIGPLELRSGD